jgi:hypothetical protein
MDEFLAKEYNLGKWWASISSVQRSS